MYFYVGLGTVHLQGDKWENSSLQQKLMIVLIGFIDMNILFQTCMWGVCGVDERGGFLGGALDFGSDGGTRTAI